ncbi:hypothetical protein AAG906_018838 [Vitis piasezkii]
MEGGLLTQLALRPVPQPVPPHFRMDLHCSYHQGLGHDTDHCIALRHAIQYLIDQGLVNLRQPSVDGVSLGLQVPTPFSLIPDGEPFQLAHSTPLIQIVTRSGRIAQPPPPPVKPFEGVTSHEEVRRVDDKVLRQLQIGCSSHRVPSVLLDNGSALNVCPLATTIALGFSPSDFGPSTQTVRAYDSTKREVMGTLVIDLHIGPATFSTLFQFIHDGRVITVQSTRDMFASSEPILQISHNEDDLFFTRFTFDEIQTLEIEDFYRDFVAMSFDQHNNIVVLDMMRATIDHDTKFGLGFVPTEVDYRYMVRLRKERVRAHLSHTPFNYSIQPYRMSLVNYFVKGSDIQPRIEEIDSVVHTDREIELQHLFHQLQLSDGVPSTSVSMEITPPSPDRASLLSLCFLEEVTDDGVVVDPTEMIDGVVPYDECQDEMDMMTVSQITSIVKLHPVSPFDMFGVSTIKNDRLIHLLRSYLDVFASSYEDMSGLDPSIVQHHLPILPHARLVKQKLRRLHPRWSLQVKEKIQKQLSVGLILVVEYPEWLANVVLVPKKDGKVRVCVDFRDLNKASPKDDFPLQHIDLLNIGATYQRVATTLFHDMMHRDVEVYVDDMIVKSQGQADHLAALERFFERIRKFKLRLNPKKCTFGVTFGKLLGHMVSERGIKVDPGKIKAILDMPVSRTEKEIRGFLDRL